MARTQSPEVESFLKRVLALPKGPGVQLDPVLKPSLEDETQLRRLFATDKNNTHLRDPHVGLVDVFDAPAEIRTTRARVLKDEADINAQYVMPLSETNRRKEGTPSMVSDIEEFKKNWNIFSEGSLSQLLDWNNVVAAGGAVLACLTPLSDAAKVSKRSIRKYYHSTAYPTSDVDLFLWGLTPEQAELKITKIYEAVRDSVPWDVTCVRTKHTVSIHSQYPYRSVQIVLRLYNSPAEILAGFDIDAPCCAYDGSHVYANPRAIVAMMRQCNTVDMTRRSPSYEVRLSKYSARAFEVYVPTLARADIDPTIYERSIVRITGLARLLVLEKLTNTDERFAFLETRRTLRGRPNPLNQYNRRQKRKFKGDLKAEGMALSVLEMNDYDVESLHIPYGPGWDARRIDKLVYQTDLGMNSTFNPKNKGRRLHRHPAFFGTIEECMDDCCEHCPAPIDEDERKLQAEEDESYIRGRISFIQDDPGRQTLSGSFNPIDVGEWSEQVYIGPTERFFAAIAAYDRAAVARMLAQGQDIDRRDHVGRTPLHVAILCHAVDIACDLVDAGARMTARLVDGRTSLHLAAQQDLLPVVRKLLERSAINAEQVPKAVDAEDDATAGVKADPDRASSEDDWSSEEDDMVVTDEGDGDSEGSGDAKPAKAKAADKQSDSPTNVGDLPEDEPDAPDVFEINLADWDFSFTALAHAIVSGSPPVVEALLNAGADVKLVSQAKGSPNAVLPLTLTILGDDDERTCKIAERLILAGASSSAADAAMRTVFHRAVLANKPNLVTTFLRCDPNAKTALNYPTVGYTGGMTPLVTAISAGNYSVIAALVAHGVQLIPSEEVLQRAFADSSQFSYVQDKQYVLPVETALSRHDDVVRLLADIGAEINIGVRQALRTNSRPEDRRTLTEWVQYALTVLTEQIADIDSKIDPPEISAADALPGWKGHLANYTTNLRIKIAQAAKESTGVPRWEVTRRANLIDAKEYYTDMEKLLLDRGAKPWSAIYPDNVSAAFEPKAGNIVAGAFSNTLFGRRGNRSVLAQPFKYYRMTGSFQQEPVMEFLDARYDVLFEACFTGANEKIEELCLPAGNANKDETPLQISVAAADDGNRYLPTGVTPLFAAISGRHWDTARLIIAIAAAQNKPAAQTARFNTSGINLEDDSDNESDESDDSDYTIEQDGIDFVDIATRPSAVECAVHPKDLFKGGSLASEPLSKAIDDNDFEAFINIFNLYKHSPKHIDLPNYLLTSIIRHDRVDMLDEYIRRTGLGLKILNPTAHREEEIPVVNDKNKVYLGLSVHGKKRTDLAKRNDPNASQTEVQKEIPLVWQAVSHNATSVLDYLLGDRPLTAYQFYASSHSSDSATLLKRTPDLEKVLPEWLGWSVTPLGESPLTAAIVSKNRDTVRYLFKKAPRLMASSLHERVKFLGVNSLMLAVQVGCDAPLIDFLLAKSVSPAERDQINGWNIFHHMCAKNHHELLKHLLNKLPRDVVEALLSQQSKGRLNTPLHICVKRGFKKAAQLVVEFSNATALVRDVDGSIPLHCAVRAGFPEIIQILVDAAPSGLHMENGVGEAPSEIAELQALIARNQELQNQNYGVSFGSGVDLQSPTDTPPRLDIGRLDVELPKFRKTLETLVERGLLKMGTQAATAMFAFAEHMEWKLVAAKAARNIDSVAESVAEKGDSAKALKNVKAVVGVVDGHRELVHLVDVQTSVQNSLSRPKSVPQTYQNYRRNYRRARDEDGLEPEEDQEQKELQSAFIYNHVQTQLDVL
ncbi:ankyrin repeat protein [Mycena maculata]|uniref:Ankyrin repeat protein n=1 Tax=Mycena maculata TaxID=230809 RepID=A0AAD7K2Q5_9AGAR|nr:ankyrin repeat protein [Mycena maculata]